MMLEGGTLDQTMLDDKSSDDSTCSKLKMINGLTFKNCIIHLVSYKRGTGSMNYISHA
jgi:hypothetical protein